MPAYLSLKGIKGEATEKKHKEWIIIQSMSAPISRSIPPGAKDMQRARGETTLGDIVVVRELDSSSTLLGQACANGSLFAEAQVDFCSTIKNKQETYLTYKMKDVIISGYSFHANSTGNPLPTEEFTMNFTAIEWTYYKLKPEDLTPQGQVVGSYNPGVGATS